MVDTTLVFDLLARDQASRTVLGFGKNVDSTRAKLVSFGVHGGVAFATLAAAAAVFTVKVGVGYVKSLNQVQALTYSNNKQMQVAATQLESNSAKYAQMGQTTGDAASGLVELTKAGLTLHQALNAILPTMTLAKSGALSVGEASSITANAMSTFHLKAKDTASVVNDLANAADISTADVSDLADSFKYVAPVAANSGVSIKQLSAILAELANSGIKASQAGTTTRTALLNLYAPGGAAATVLQELGVQTTTASGALKPFPAVIDLLSQKMKGLSAATREQDLKALFGKTGIAGGTVLLKEGAKGFAQYAKGVVRTGGAMRLATANSKGLAGSFDIIKSSAISGAQSLYRQFSPIADKVIRPLAAKFAGFAQNLGPNMAAGLQKIHGVLDKLDISGLGNNLAKQAQAWAAPVIAGFNVGLNTGDWSGLGKALGNGLVKAAGALGDLSSKLGTVLSKIDWVGIGIDMGKQAPSLFIGLAAGILTFDPMSLLKGMAKHWQDVVLAVLMVAFTPAKIIDGVGEILLRIPLAGRLLEWGLLAFKRFSDGAVGAAFDAIKFIGREMLVGFRRVFPEVGKVFTEELRILPTRIGVIAIDVAERGLKMVRGLGSAIVRGTGFVAGKIGELIGNLLRPWADSGSWLVKRGVELLSGLVRGIASKVGDVLAPLRALGGRALSAVGGLGNTLWNAGVDLIKGFIGGIGSMFGAVKDKLGSLTSKFTSWKGPPEKDRTILTPAGVMLMEGLVAGITKGEPLVKTALARVTSYISAQRDKLNSLLSAKADFAAGFQSFTTSVFSTDLTHSTTDADGNTTTTPATVQDMIAYQRQERAKARQLKADVARLHRMGLSNSLIKQLQASGPEGEAEIHTLAGGTESQIHQLNALNKQTDSALAGAGQIGGSQLYNDQIAQTRNNEDLAERIAKKLHAAMQHAGKDEYAVVTLDGKALITAIRRVQRKKGQKPTV